MNENQFDEFFRNKLLNYSSPIPEDMWQRIHQKKDEDRGGFFLKWILAILLLTFLTVGYFIWHSNKNINNEKDMSAVNKLNIGTQNKPDKLLNNSGTNESVKVIPDTSQLFQTNKRISLNKEVNNNKTDIDSNKHPNKKSKTDQYFSVRRTTSDKYISKQKELTTRQIITSKSFKDSANINVKNVSDSSINNYEANEGIVKNYRDSSNKKRAIRQSICLKILH